MRYQRTKRDELRALTSEVLPYEVPLPFSTVRMYGFLRHIKFKWIDENNFSVSNARYGKAERYWLKLIFDGVKIGTGTVAGDRRLFDLRGAKGGTARMLHPYKYRSRRNNGKNRELSVPHPQSMMGIAYLFNEFRDTILYFTNRSNYSIRHPHRVARVFAKRDLTFKRNLDAEQFGFEQHDLEYEYVTSYFSYRRFSNINRFYSSSEFRACERKYPLLMRADVSKCFDSIYTHTISWVTNGRGSSKANREKAGQTFGARFDRYMQYLNYAETSGIVIGPEFSRVFSEIILQEVDVLVERDLSRLSGGGLERGRDYDIMRYVDDYFIFLGDSRRSGQVEEVLARNLAKFKLHLNEGKQKQFETPLRSNMSVAKLAVRESLKNRTVCAVDEEDSAPPTLFFSAERAILDYKAILINAELDHGELANSLLHDLGWRSDHAIGKYEEGLEQLGDDSSSMLVRSAHSSLVKYMIAVLDVALFVYAGAPSVSHSIKLTRLIAGYLRVLELRRVGYLEVQSFRDKVRREILAQLSTSGDLESFGVHTLNLLDCLCHLDSGVDEITLREILDKRCVAVEGLDAFGILTFLRCCAGRADSVSLEKELLEHARSIIDLGDRDVVWAAQRSILMLSIVVMPGGSISNISEATSISKGMVAAIRRQRINSSLYSWNANDHFYERLQLKSSQMVY